MYYVGGVATLALIMILSLRKKGNSIIQVTEVRCK